MVSNFNDKNPIYSECSSIPKTLPERQTNESVLKEIGDACRVLPLYEKGVFERSHINHYSLKTNEYLKCCWTKYKENAGSRVYTAFQFPDIKDLHFHNYTVKYIPREKKYLFDNRIKLGLGPGIDNVGQRPIPVELIMRRNGDIKIKPEKTIGKSKKAKK